MLVTCHECHAKYSIADEKLCGRAARVRCRRCSTLIEVVAPSASAAPAAAYPDEAYPSRQPEAARRAAVLPRGTERARRDLFAPVDVAHSASSAPATTPPVAFVQAGVAARNENSVLFSLSALGGSISHTAPQATTKSKDDSGLIDLNALMAAPLTSKSVPAPVASDAPVGAFAFELAPAAPPPRKRKLFVGLGVAAVLLAVVGLQLAVRSADREAAATVPPPVAAPVVVATPIPAPAPSPVLAAAPPSDAKPIAVSSAGERPHAKGKHDHAGARHASARSAAPVSHATPAAADPCHCHGNLMCSMKCSAH